ncbi:MAG: hypothetical protein ACHQF2_06970 [Flavobacteriales bacterium]
MKSTAFFFFLFTSAFSFSQNPLKIKFDKTFPADQSLVLYSYDKTALHIIKTFTSEGKDSILLTGLKEPGLCYLTVMESMNMGEFIYNPNENMTIEISYGPLISGQLTIKNSKENVCYNDLQKINNAYDLVLDTLHAARMSIPVSATNYYKKCLSTDSLFEQVAREKNARLTALQFYYMRTFTSQVLVPFHLIPVASPEEKKKYQTPYAYIRDFYFKYAVTDKRALRDYSMYNSINRYFMVYTTQDDNGIKKSIDFVQSSFNKDTAVSAEISRFLAQSFVDQSLPKYAWYVLGHAQKGCAVPWKDAGQDFAGNSAHIKKGNTVDDIVLNDINGTPVSLSNACKKTKQTLLLFWQPGCAQNDTLFPKIIQALGKKKITVFAVFLGANMAEWKKQVATYKLQNWVHVSELKPIENSNLVWRYMVAGTPTMYLLSGSRSVKERINHVSGLSQALNQK